MMPPSPLDLITLADITPRVVATLAALADDLPVPAGDLAYFEDFLAEQRATQEGRVLCLSFEPEQATECERLMEDYFDSATQSEARRGGHFVRATNLILRYSPTGEEVLELWHFVPLSYLPKDYPAPRERIKSFPQEPWHSPSVVLANLLLDAILGKAKIFRCAECNCPAVRSRDWQEFCTYRCQNRAHARRKRAHRALRTLALRTAQK